MRLALALLLAGCGSGGGTVPNVIDANPGQCTPLPELTAQEVATGLTRPVAIAEAPGDGRLYVVEQWSGRVVIFPGGKELLKVTDLVTSDEQGLLGLVFHPQHAANGKLYVDYTESTHTYSMVVQYTRSGDTAANPATIIQIPQEPAGNHKAGNLQFGPDGKLYIGTGDGGDANDLHGSDNHRNAQDTSKLLGKFLRIDVDAGSPYVVPSDNPFVGQAGVKPEIWSIGWRNPWRWSFDRLDGSLWVGDVGQYRWEEIDVEPPASGGRNYGWPIVEGNGHCSQDAGGTCSLPGSILPVYEYNHDGGSCAVIGGYVYRGSALSCYQGHYFFSDNCGGWIRSFDAGDRPYAAAKVKDHAFVSDLAIGSISTFGQALDGELYFCSLLGGKCWKIVAK